MAEGVLAAWLRCAPSCNEHARPGCRESVGQLWKCQSSWLAGGPAIPNSEKARGDVLSISHRVGCLGNKMKWRCGEGGQTDGSVVDRSGGVTHG